MTFGNKLKRLRGGRAVSQRALALALNVDAAYLSRVESSAAKYTPNVETIQRIAKALKLSRDEADELYVLANKLPPDIERKLLSRPQLFQEVRRA
jgi:transcriptional regulator with XRE-family HTH domain